MVENVHLSESLMRLSYRVCSMQDEKERMEKEQREQEVRMSGKGERRQLP